MIGSQWNTTGGSLGFLKRIWRSTVQTTARVIAAKAKRVAVREVDDRIHDVALRSFMAGRSRLKSWEV